MSGAITPRCHRRVAWGDTTPALHNCGPGPQTVYRTAAVGRMFTLDPAALLDWQGLPDTLRRRTVHTSSRSAHGVPSADDRPAPERIAAIANFLLHELTLHRSDRRSGLEAGRPEPATTPLHTPHEHTCAALVALRDALIRTGHLGPFLGLARWTARDGATPPRREPYPARIEYPWLPAGDAHVVLRVAWCVCAVSHFAPPLILWYRSPSLVWWRSDGLIALRWFGSAPDGTPPTGRGAQ